MYRIRTLIIFLFGIQSALVASAQGVSLDLFPAYQTENQVTVPTNPLDPAFAPAMYNHRQKMERGSQSRRRRNFFEIFGRKSSYEVNNGRNFKQRFFRQREF